MEITLDKTTHIGLGHTAQADAFQGGREAAQMAKSQLPNGDFDLVLAFGPESVRFKDFVEGVRLVTGEEALVGIPTNQVASSEFTPPDSYFVVILQAAAMRFSIAGHSIQSENLLAGGTSLISQFRQLRGNEIRNYKYSGVILFQHSFVNLKKPFAYNIGTDLGLETWMAGGSPFFENENPLVCKSVAIDHGVLGIECLSQKPWGVGSVSTGAFPSQPDIFREASKSAMREALVHLNGNKAALGLIFFDLDEEDPDKIHTILEGAMQIVPHTPLLAVPMERRYIRSIGRALEMKKESVVSVLVPQ